MYAYTEGEASSPWIQDTDDPSRKNTTTTYERKLSSLRTRWTVLACVSGVSIGLFYCFDIPSSLHQQMKDHMMPNIDNFELEFNLLYTLYSVPNIILPFFGGKIVDYFSASKSLVAFSSLTLLGQLIFSIGIATKCWHTMHTGRIVYGLGAENLSVAQSALLTNWFDGKELALCFGIFLSISRMGTVLNNLISPQVANSSSVTDASFLAFGVSLISTALAILVIKIEKKAIEKCRQTNENLRRLTEPFLQDQNLQQNQEEKSSFYPPRMEDGQTSARSNQAQAPIKFDLSFLQDFKRLGVLFWILSTLCMLIYGVIIPFNSVASGIVLERNYFKAPPVDCKLERPNECSSGTLAKGNNTAILANGDVCPIPDKNNYAPVLPSSITITASEYPHHESSSWEEKIYAFPELSPEDINCEDSFWANACTKNYCDDQKAATSESARVISIPYFLSAITAPIFGYFVDIIGNRAQLATLAAVISFGVHTTLASGEGSPVFPLVFQGVAYSIFASVIWPSVPLVVDEDLTGTAFGLISSIQNAGLALFPIIVASIYKAANQRYIPTVEVFFILLATLGIISGVGLIYMDNSLGGKLKQTSSSRQEDSDEQQLPEVQYNIVNMDENNLFQRSQQGYISGLTNNEYI